MSEILLITRVAKQLLFMRWAVNLVNTLYVYLIFGMPIVLFATEVRSVVEHFLFYVL